MLCDRDAIHALGRKAVGEEPDDTVRELPRYHIENYFLDENVLASAFSKMESEGHWLRDAHKIKAKVLEIARSVVPYAVALNVNAIVRESVGNVSLMPKGVGEVGTKEKLVEMIVARLSDEERRVTSGLRAEDVGSLVSAEFDRLMNAVDSDSEVWRKDLPGRQILHKFASVAGISPAV